MTTAPAVTQPSESTETKDRNHGSALFTVDSKTLTVVLDLSKFQDKDSIRLAFDDAKKGAAAEVLSAKASLKDHEHAVLLWLAKVRAILSQKGDKRIKKLRLDAKLPSWTKFLKEFLAEHGLDWGERNVRHKLAALAGRPRKRNRNKSDLVPAGKGKADNATGTEQTLSNADLYPAMLDDIKAIFDLIDREWNKAPTGVLKKCDDFRETYGLPKAVRAPVAPKPEKTESVEKQSGRVEKVVKGRLKEKKLGGIFSVTPSAKTA